MQWAKLSVKRTRADRLVIYFCSFYLHDVVDPAQEFHHLGINAREAGLCAPSNLAHNSRQMPCLVLLASQWSTLVALQKQGDRERRLAKLISTVGGTYSAPTPNCWNICFDIDGQNFQDNVTSRDVGCFVSSWPCWVEAQDCFRMQEEACWIWPKIHCLNSSFHTGTPQKATQAGYKDGSLSWDVPSTWYSEVQMLLLYMEVLFLSNMASKNPRYAGRFICSSFYGWLIPDFVWCWFYWVWKMILLTQDKHTNLVFHHWVKGTLCFQYISAVLDKSWNMISITLIATPH